MHQSAMRSPRPLASRRCHRSPRRRRPLPLLRRLPAQRPPASRPALPHAPPLPNRPPSPPSETEIALDFPLLRAIINVVDNCAWRAGACSRFSSCAAAVSIQAAPKQPKTCPLESINYELQSLQVLSFDIHACNGGWGVGIRFCAAHRALHDLAAEVSLFVSFSCALFCAFLHQAET